jgi:hypothetical protein
MTRIGLYDLDNNGFPNLALMKLSAYHKQQGDSAELYSPLSVFDKVYVAKVFSYTPDYQYEIQAEVKEGGTGFDLTNCLRSEVESCCPDYNLYPEVNYALGFLTRGCSRNCPFSIVNEKEGGSHKVADLSTWYKGQKEIKLLDPNLLESIDREDLLVQLAGSKAAIDFTQGLDIRFVNDDIIKLFSKLKVKRYHFAWDQMQDSRIIQENLLKTKNILGLGRSKISLYILTNFDTSFEEDMFRIEWCLKNDIFPDVRIFNKHKLPPRSIYYSLQSWTYKYCYTGDLWDWLRYKKSKIPPEFIGTKYENIFYDKMRGDVK